MIFHDIQQNSDEWFQIRTGKVTTSKFGLFMANYGKSFGEPAQRYAFKIAKEQLTGVRDETDTYTNQNMDNGHVYEPIARDEYSHATFNDVSNGGFCQHEKYLSVGGSPDGLVLDQNGGVEIKSVIDWTHRNNIKRNSFDPSYRWQILGNIWLCNLEWLDFVSYGYSYTESRKLFVYRVNRHDYQNQIDMIEPRLNEFLSLIEDEKKYL